MEETARKIKENASCWYAVYTAPRAEKKVKEQIIFPEIDYDKIEKLRGMNIAITTTAQTDEEARELLRLMGAPFAN